LSGWCTDVGCSSTPALGNDLGSCGPLGEFVRGFVLLRNALGTIRSLDLRHAADGGELRTYSVPCLCFVFGFHNVEGIFSSSSYCEESETSGRTINRTMASVAVGFGAGPRALDLLIVRGVLLFTFFRMRARRSSFLRHFAAAEFW
jgi:hypothetical protein